MKTFSFIAASVIALNSCAAVKKVGSGSIAAVKMVGSGSVAAVKKVGSGSVSMVKSASSATANGVAALIPGERIKVVEVREKDLRELPTGREQLARYDRENERKRGLLASVNPFGKFPLFSGRGGADNVPVPKLPFKESDLPPDGVELDAGVLPPLPN